MCTLIIFDSEYGNTREIAEAIGTELRTAGPVDVVKIDSSGVAASTFEMDVLIVGGPTQAHGLSPHMREFLAHLPAESISGVEAAAFDTRLRGWRLVTGAASDGIAKQLQHLGAHLVVPPQTFVVTGKEGPLADEELTHAQQWARHILDALPTPAATPMSPANTSPGG